MRVYRRNQNINKLKNLANVFFKTCKNPLLTCDPGNKESLILKSNQYEWKATFISRAKVSIGVRFVFDRADRHLHRLEYF